MYKIKTMNHISPYGLQKLEDSKSAAASSGRTYRHQMA